MFYVGQFSFDAPEEGASLESLDRGSFTCLVEAETVEEAVEKFGDLVISLDDSFEAFESVGDVYLDHITEVIKLPQEGVLSYFERRTGDRLGTISTALPGVPPEFCGSYDWGRRSPRTRKTWRSASRSCITEAEAAPPFLGRPTPTSAPDQAAHSAGYPSGARPPHLWRNAWKKSRPQTSR